MDLLPPAKLQRRPPITVRVLVIQRGNDQWLAQGLDCDIAAQGQSDDQAIRSFLRLLQARIRRDLQNGRQPLEGLPPAPDHFFDKWERLERKFDRLVTDSNTAGNVPAAYVIQQILQRGSGVDLT